MVPCSKCLSLENWSRVAAKYRLTSIVVCTGGTMTFGSPWRGRHTSTCELLAFGGLSAYFSRRTPEDSSSTYGRSWSMGPSTLALSPSGFDGSTCKKGKEAYLYSAFYILCISRSAHAHAAQAWITQFYLQIHHACLSFVCVHQMAPPITDVRDIKLQLTIHLSTPKG